MSNISKNLDYSVKAKKGTRVAIAVAQYNPEITHALQKSCRNTLIRQGVPEKNIRIVEVPGAFELPFACRKLAISKKFDAVIALGAIIKGETPHFDFVAIGATLGIMKINLAHDTPVIFGMLTTQNLRQAQDRIAGGKAGDKGAEAALSALKMFRIKF